METFHFKRKRKNDFWKNQNIFQNWAGCESWRPLEHLLAYLLGPLFELVTWTLHYALDIQLQGWTEGLGQGT